MRNGNPRVRYATTIAERKERMLRRFYSWTHLLLVAGGSAFFLSVVGWIVWRIWIGTTYALALGTVVSALLLAIGFMAMRSLVIVALEGLREDEGNSIRRRIRASEMSVTSEPWRAGLGRSLRASAGGKRPRVRS